MNANICNNYCYALEQQRRELEAMLRKSSGKVAERLQQAIAANQAAWRALCDAAQKEAA